MGDVDEGDAELALQLAQLQLEVLAQLGVEGAEGLVEEQHARVQHQRASQRHPLLLPAGELGRAALGRAR